MLKTLSKFYIISILFLSCGCTFTPSAELDRWHSEPHPNQDEGQALLIGSVHCVFGGVKELPATIVQTCITAQRIPETDNRRIPQFDDKNYSLYRSWDFGNDPRTPSRGLSEDLEAYPVKPGRYLITPYICLPICIDDNGIIKPLMGTLTYFSPLDYLGVLEVNDGDVIYFGDILIYKDGETVIGAINNLDKAIMFLERTHPEMVDKLRFKPFVDDFCKVLTKEQTIKIFQNLGNYTTTKIAIYRHD